MRKNPRKTIAVILLVILAAGVLAVIKWWVTSSFLLGH